MIAIPVTIGETPDFVVGFPPKGLTSGDVFSHVSAENLMKMHSHMPNLVRVRPTPWNTVFLLCRKCSGKMKGGYGRKGKETLRTALRAELTAKGHKRGVPFLLAKQVLAEALCLPQVVLVKTTTNADEGDDGVEHRFASAFSDLLRSLGVVPMGNSTPQDLAALTVAQVNTSLQAGTRVQSQAVPLAAQVRDGVLWAALPGADGLPDWKPYAEIYLAMTAGGHLRFGRARGLAKQARFQIFWQQALRDIANSGGGLVLVDAASGRQWMGGMANGKLAFDRLDVGSGNTPLFPSDLPGVRLARITHGDAKLPSYFHAEDAGWVSGVFTWPGSMRTAFGLKQKPQSNKSPKAFSTTWRHHDPDAGMPSVREDTERKFAAIDETCAFFLQPGDDPMAVVQRVNGYAGSTPSMAATPRCLTRSTNWCY